MSDNKFNELKDKKNQETNLKKEKEFFAKMSPQVQKEMDLLKKQEAKILQNLQKEEVKLLFIKNPFEALNKMNVEIPPIIRSKLQQVQDLSGIVASKQYMLPNGKTITPKIKINFTPMKGE